METKRSDRPTEDEVNSTSSPTASEEAWNQKQSTGSGQRGTGGAPGFGANLPASEKSAEDRS